MEKELLLQKYLEMAIKVESLEREFEDFRTSFVPIVLYGLLGIFILNIASLVLK